MTALIYSVNKCLQKNPFKGGNTKLGVTTTGGNTHGQKANLVTGNGRDGAFNVIAIDGVEVYQFVLSQVQQPDKHC